MDQLDTLTILKDKFEADIIEHGSDPTAKVEKAIQGKIYNSYYSWIQYISFPHLYSHIFHVYL